jgi:hypothetical protein
MAFGLRYRLASVGGTVLTVVLAVLLANNATVQQVSTTSLPVVSQIEPQMLTAERLTITVSPPRRS